MAQQWGPGRPSEFTLSPGPPEGGEHSQLKQSSDLYTQSGHKPFPQNRTQFQKLAEWFTGVQHATSASQYTTQLLQA